MTPIGFGAVQHRHCQLWNYGDCRSLKGGVFELRFMFGPGYGVYFGEDGETIVVLLCGGDKSSQVQDRQSEEVLEGVSESCLNTGRWGK